ncbi:Insulin-degrading enzyme [Portunus trituberculatus]|uniref:Insulin-degrading enzyme n=1 Tax=Portunus trituberculatus TaxID=210409 RepID=A0A5B7DW23_PORTR|nr:Insulin-degrading enzyme [Portunus trituberculatus]
MTVETVEAFIPRFLSGLHVEMLIHGNMRKESAATLATTLQDQLTSRAHTRPLLPSQLVRQREYQLRDGKYGRICGCCPLDLPHHTIHHHFIHYPHHHHFIHHHITITSSTIYITITSSSTTSPLLHPLSTSPSLHPPSTSPSLHPPPHHHYFIIHITITSSTTTSPLLHPPSTSPSLHPLPHHQHFIHRHITITSSTVTSPLLHPPSHHHYFIHRHITITSSTVTPPSLHPPPHHHHFIHHHITITSSTTTTLTTAGTSLSHHTTQIPSSTTAATSPPTPHLTSPLTVPLSTTGSSQMYRAENSVHKSSAVETYFQCGMQETHNNMLLELLCQIFAEPAFDELRTKEQLGYIVWCGIRRANGTQGLRIIVQGDRHPEYLTSRIEAFLHKMGDNLEKLPEEDFVRHREALASRRLERPKKLSHLTGNWWAEITSNQYNFDRDALEVAHLRTLTKDDVIDFYKSSLIW